VSFFILVDRKCFIYKGLTRGHQLTMFETSMHCQPINEVFAHCVIIITAAIIIIIIIAIIIIVIIIIIIIDL